MEKNATLNYFRKYVSFVTAIGTLLLLNNPVQAQVGCANARSFGTETFGTGTTPTSDPYVVTSVLTYQATGDLSGEGTYRVTTNTQQKAEWLNSTDHTGNANGKMLVVNGQAESFYQRSVIYNQGFAPGNYNISLFIMNIDGMGVCSPNPLLPILTFTVEYLSASNTWVPLGGSPYTAAPVQQNGTPTWINQGASFSLPSTGSFLPKNIRVTLSDGTVGGCGNDFALDDMNFSFCPEGGPLPVEFMDVTASTKGSGVSIDWSTAQEINNRYFEVERSADGNNDWTNVATVNGAGNSQLVRNYAAFDASPVSGINYYRIKQVDFDGNAKYSKTVNVKVDAASSGVTVLANPFHNTLSVNFRSASSQQVSARLYDITGKQVASENWSLSQGTIRKDFSSISALQPGMYILSIRSNSGNLLYNGKVLKQ